MMNRKKKRKGEIPPFNIIILSLLFLCCLAFSSCVQPQRKKARFGGDHCTECHQQKVQAYLQKNRVHKPVKDTDCSRCHEPHGYIGTLHLWEEGTAELCFRCHPKIKAQISLVSGPNPLPLSQGSVHKAVQKEKCTICHDPHASDNAGLAKKSGQELCFGCHDRKPFTRSNKHKALEKGCQLCHLPHASKRANLLVAEEKELCLQCHRMRDSRLVAAHQGYPVETHRCTECHDPHSSDPSSAIDSSSGIENNSLMRSQVHKPMKEKKCSFCHLPPDSKEPFRLKKEKIDELCYQCHSREKYLTEGSGCAQIEGTHQPIKEGKCLGCHAPHASDFKGLLAVRESQGCYQCHQKVLKETGQTTVHQPLKNDQCSVCHDPHTGKVKWPQNGRQADLCYQCHDHDLSHHDSGQTLGHAQEKGRSQHKITHEPVQKGECLSCHTYHASKFPGMLKEAIPRLCYQCHPKEEKRFNKVNAHTPVQNGNCLGCHDAHAGDKNLLLLSPKELCWSCHLSLQKQLGGATLHTPVRDGQCMECHDPHASDYKNMLVRDNGHVCLSSQCHQPLARTLGGGICLGQGDKETSPPSPRPPVSPSPLSVEIHSPVKDYQCMACHNPHGSKIPHQLLSQSSTLCFPCHKGLEEKIKPATENVHPPVREGKCLTCHIRHVSGYPSLLAKGGDSMCLECHRKDEKAFSRAHGGIELKKEHCLDCHDPHASEGKGLFRRVTHKPFQSKKCDVCHKNAK